MVAHEALYRKYRPRSFADLVGQTQVSRTLEYALREGRISHAYLFTGPRGTGKTSSARILATSLNCVKGPTPEPCGICDSCVAIRQGHHLDVIEIDAASNRSVDDARDLRERVRFAPTSGRYKVFIIDEVHMLTREAFNALLKTLEEPPPNLVFILATTDVHQVLATVTSRCQRYDFRPIPHDVLMARLEDVARLEGFSVESGGLQAIARKAAGGLRDALSILDQVRAFAAGTTITQQEVLESLGVVAQDALVDLLEALGQRAIVPALGQLQSLLDQGLAAGLVLRELLESFRHLLVARASEGSTRDPGLKDPLGDLLSEPLRLALPRLLTEWDAPEILWAIEALRETDRSMRASHQDTLWLELALVRLTDRPRVASLIELERRVSAIEARLAQGPVPPRIATATTRSGSPGAVSPPVAVTPVAAAPVTPAPAPMAPLASEPPQASPAPVPPVEAGAIAPGDVLSRLVSTLQTVHVTTHSLAQQHAVGARLDAKRLTVSVKALINLFEQRRQHLVKAAAIAFGDGTEVVLTLETGGGPPPDPRSAGVSVGQVPPASAPGPIPSAPEPAKSLDEMTPPSAPGGGSTMDVIERTLEFFNGRLVSSGD